MFIAVRLDNYITLPYTIFHISFILTSVTTHTSITECKSSLLGNTCNKIVRTANVAGK